MTTLLLNFCSECVEKTKTTPLAADGEEVPVGRGAKKWRCDWCGRPFDAAEQSPKVVRGLPAIDLRGLGGGRPS